MIDPAELEALAKQFGGTVAPANAQTFNVQTDAGKNVAIDVRFPSAEMTAQPETQQDRSMPAAATDVASLAAQFGGTITEPPTTAKGLAGAATRGLALPAAGALAGGAAGALLGGVGAIPGAIAGAGAATLAGLIGDPIVGSINSLFGTKYTMPTDAMEDLLTRVGVAEPRTAAERIMQTTAAGASSAVGGVAAGQALQAAARAPVKPSSLAEQGSAVTREVGRLLAATPGFQALAGGTAAAAGGVAKEAGAGPVGQIAATVGGALIPSIPAATRAVTQQVARQVAPAGAGIRERIEPTSIEQLRAGQEVPTEPTIRESLQSIKASVSEKLSPQDSATLRKQIAQDPASTELVNFRISGTQAVPDNEAASAITQGWKDGTIASIKAASDKDRQAMTKMLNLFKIGDKNEAFKTKNRPADILGDTVQSRIDFLARSNKTSGMAIDRIARTRLSGQTVDYDPAVNSFLKDLENIGVKVELDQSGVAKANLEGSRIEGDVAGERLLNTVLKRLSKTAAPDALGVHDAKRFIDTQVDYGKRNLSNPLTAEAERIVKGLRRNLNQTLGERFPVYKAANEKYSDTITALNELQDAAGTKINFDSENANKALGTAMRKLTSNYSTRANLIDALDQANSTATKYGMKLDDDIVNQLIFVNELDRMFGAAAQTSLKAEVASAKDIGVDIARGNLRQRALDLLAEKAEDLRGINKENAVKAMEELLKRKAGQP